MKKSEESKIIMTELVMPGMTNPMGNLRGGKLMDWMDIAGALVCMKHSHSNVATILSESITFKYPVHVGDLVTIEAHLIFIGTSSMVTKITVTSEDLETGCKTQTNTALFTYVACAKINNEMRTLHVPMLQITDEIHIDYLAEQQKYNKRKEKQT